MRLIIKAQHTKIQTSENESIDLYLIDYDSQQNNHNIGYLKYKLSSEIVILINNANKITIEFNETKSSDSEIIDYLTSKHTKMEAIYFFENNQTYLNMVR